MDWDAAQRHEERRARPSGEWVLFMGAEFPPVFNDGQSKCVLTERMRESMSETRIPIKGKVSGSASCLIPVRPPPRRAWASLCPAAASAPFSQDTIITPKHANSVPTSLIFTHSQSQSIPNPIPIPIPIPPHPLPRAFPRREGRLLQSGRAVPRASLLLLRHFQPWEPNIEPHQCPIQP